MTAKTDYCTLWPDRWKTYDWSACCATHDELYDDPAVPRAKADAWLRQ